MKLWRFLKMEGSILKYRVPAFWPSYIGEVRTNFAKAYGIKVRCYWELFGKHVKNLGTLCFDPPPRKTKACMESPLSIVQVESEQWTVHSPHQTQLGKRNNLLISPTRKEVFFCFFFPILVVSKLWQFFPFLRLLSQIYTRAKNIRFFPKKICSHAGKICPKK